MYLENLIKWIARSRYRARKFFLRAVCLCYSVERSVGGVFNFKRRGLFIATWPISILCYCNKTFIVCIEIVTDNAREFSTFLNFWSKKNVTIVSLKSWNASYEKERNYFDSLRALILFCSRKNRKFSEKLYLIKINDMIDFHPFLPFLSFSYTNRRIFTQFIRDSTL